MPQIRFSEVGKTYGSFRAIVGFDAEFGDKEFVVLLGPSGCGKSTLLRMIAGLTDISSGTIEFDGRQVNELGPRERDVAFVFQSYALYPHMTVAENVAFPLLMERFRWYHHLPLVGTVYKRLLLHDRDLRARVQQIAKVMGIEEQLGKRPGALSGGQRQRVAVARALVREPSLYLLDEPLSNLDAKLRAQTRAEISALHRRTGKSFVYVTHDQVEAMTMGTQIVVLDQGRIQQIGSPDEIYRDPANTFVAQFIGSPPMNLLACRRERDGLYLEREGDGLRMVNLRPPAGAPRLLFGIRPEDVVLRKVDSSVTSSGAAIPGTVVGVERLGAEVVVSFTLESRAHTEDWIEALGTDVHYSRMPADLGLSPGSACMVEFRTDRARWFDASTGLSLTGDSSSRNSGTAPTVA